MPTVNLRLAGVYTIYDSESGEPEYNPNYGEGSNYTYMLSGTAGQSATISGSAVGDTTSVPIASLVIGDDGLPVRVTVRHAFPQLNITHTGRLVIWRSK